MGDVGLINCFVNETKNIRVVNGCLAVTAAREPQERYGMQYTSAKLTTRRSWRYGRFEMRAALPRGSMLRPSVSLEPLVYRDPWPLAGQIDIMTYVQRNTLGNNVHYGNPRVTIPMNYEYVATSDDVRFWEFHVYAVEWTPYEIGWFFDNYNHKTVSLNGSREPGMGEPFDKPFKFTLSLGVGGRFFTNQILDMDGYYDWQCSAMIVDYVRVYQKLQVVDNTIINNTTNNDIHLTDNIEKYKICRQIMTEIRGDKPIPKSSSSLSMSTTVSTSELSPLTIGLVVGAVVLILVLIIPVVVFLCIRQSRVLKIRDRDQDYEDRYYDDIVTAGRPHGMSAVVNEYSEPNELYGDNNYASYDYSKCGDDADSKAPVPPRPKSYDQRYLEMTCRK
ncbi:uncharacterized protein LOC128953486 [Oppia nitens]|uniref:uncharacterized protein LOC128953486 n=1 Tax=Oppia nitens TaxID=1686743 RepID=UPI0023DC1BA5|nr:uncharacterized protein LOC128953486 [Oppia nitens]